MKIIMIPRAESFPHDPSSAKGEVSRQRWILVPWNTAMPCDKGPATYCFYLSAPKQEQLPSQVNLYGDLDRVVEE